MLLAVIACGVDPAFADPSVVVCRTVADAEIRGSLAELGTDRVVITTEASAAIEILNAAVLEFDHPPTERRATSEWVLLGNGDRLALADLLIDGDLLSGRASAFPAWPRLALPMESIAGGVTDPDGVPRQLRTWLHRLARHSRAADIAWLANGDRISGELISLADGAYTLETAVGPVSIEPGQARAFALDPSLIQLPEPSEISAIVTFADGSWIEARQLDSNDGVTVNIDARVGLQLSVPLRDVRRIRFASPRSVPLHQLGAPELEGTGYLGSQPQVVDHRNAEGGFLSLRGREYPRGIGVTSGARLTYQLNGEFTEFSAIVGIDDSADGAGSVVFAVEGDGRRLWSSPLVTGRDPPHELPRLDVRGVSALTLIVEFGEWGDIQDLADWCLPTLWR